MVGRRIIYPCEAYIETPLINAVIAAAANLGDTGCYFSQLPTAPAYPSDNGKPSHCYIPLSEFLKVYSGEEEEDIQMQLSAEVELYSFDNVIYSASGKWGVMKSHEKKAWTVRRNPRIYCRYSQSYPRLR